MKTIIIFLGFVSLSAGILQSQQTTVTIEEFLTRPFGFEPTVAAFTNCKTPQYKLKKYIFKKHPTDTIYQFRYKKSELFFNRSQQQEIFFSGIINHCRILMLNNIYVGMSRDRFLASFSNLAAPVSDAVEIRKEGFKNVYTFIFKNNTLTEIKISNIHK